MTELDLYDHVTVRGLDGDRSDAVVVALPDTPAEEYQLDSNNGQGTTLAEYWRGYGDFAGSAVVEVRYVKGVTADGEPVTYSKSVYGFPVERCEHGLE